MRTREIRGEAIYLSLEVTRMLWLDAKSRGTQTDEQGLHRIMTADEIADNILRSHYQEKHPVVLEHLKQVEQMEKDLLKTLGGKVT